MRIPWRRAVDIIVSFMLLLNVPFVLVFETQALLPTWAVPRALQSLLKWHVHANGDFFLRRSPPFYLGVIVADLFIRVPLMLLNAYAFYHDRSWADITALFYGVHTASIMIPVMFELYFARVTRRHRLLVAFLLQLLVSIYMILRVVLLNSHQLFKSLAIRATAQANQQAVLATRSPTTARNTRIQELTGAVPSRQQARRAPLQQGNAAPVYEEQSPAPRQQTQAQAEQQQQSPPRQNRQTRQKTRSPAAREKDAAGTSQVAEQEGAGEETGGSEVEAEYNRAANRKTRTTRKRKPAKRRKSVPRKIGLREFIDNAAIVVRRR